MQILHNMELAWIEDFIALNETRNFTAAADMRHSTQPAFSRRIQSLENWLGATLFDRHERPIFLTRAGDEFEKRAYRLREDMLDARRVVNITATDMPDAVAIYTTNTIAVGLLPQWILDNNIASYRLVVSSVTACIDAVRQKRCDYALIPSFPGLKMDVPDEGEIVAHDKMIFKTTKQQPITIKDNLIHGPVLMYSPKTAFGSVIKAGLNRDNIRLSSAPVCESASAEALLAQVKAGLGGGWVIESLIDGRDKLQSVNEIFNIPFDIMLIKSKS